MKVTPDAVASIRALLTGDMGEFTRIGNGLDQTGRQARGALISAAFFKAAVRRFDRGGTEADVVAFVSELRAGHGLTEELDPRTAERLLLAAFAEEEIEDIGARERGEHFIILLARLIMDERLSDTELDAFLEESRALADRWLAD